MDNIEDKLFTVKCKPDDVSHLLPDKEACKLCKSKVCTIVCPANVYEHVAQTGELVVKYENCLECGACRIACEKKTLKWTFPKGNKGVIFRNG